MFSVINLKLVQDVAAAVQTLIRELMAIDAERRAVIVAARQESNAKKIAIVKKKLERL